MKTYKLATYNRTSNLYRWWANCPNESDDSEYLPFPEEIVQRWFAEEGVVGRYYHLIEQRNPCEYWANHLYMISEIDDLYHYAKDHGCTWTRYFSIGGKKYTLDNLTKIFNDEICLGDPYGQNDDNTPFWDWISSLQTLNVIEDDYVEVDIKKNRYTVSFTMTGRVEVEATSEAEAKMLASGMEITWDDYGGEITGVVKEE